METFTEHEFVSNDIKTAYLQAGPEDGPLLIFVHGWPGIAETWKRQLVTFASLGFRVIAPDTRGYGNSTSSRNIRDYSLEPLVGDQLRLLAHLGREEAVWIAHDWGCGIVWALAAHHPEVCVGVVSLCVPYRTLELGVEELEKYINRSIYPEKEYPHGQWDYQRFYEQYPGTVITTLEANVGNSVAALFSRPGPASYGQPARTSTIIKDGGWFGGADHAPSVPLERTCLDEDLLKKLRDSFERTGFFGATAYYLNHDVNRPYGLEKSANNGYLHMPNLFIEAKYDAVCATSLCRISEPMRKYCTDLTECSVDAGHWVQLERPQEVNAALARWLATKLLAYWPGYWRTPLVASTAKI